MVAFCKGILYAETRERPRHNSSDKSLLAIGLGRYGAISVNEPLATDLERRLLDATASSSEQSDYDAVVEELLTAYLKHVEKSAESIAK